MNTFLAPALRFTRTNIASCSNAIVFEVGVDKIEKFGALHACVCVCVCVCVQALLNCTSSPPTSDIDSREACVTLYHFRGHRRGGYFFALHVVAGYGQ